MIKREGDAWVLYTKDGKKRLGKFDSEEAAKKRERQIQFFKTRGKLGESIATLHEELLTLGEDLGYLPGLTAHDADDNPSYETVISAIGRVLEDQWRADYQTGDVESGNGMPMRMGESAPMCRYKVVATFQGSFVYCDEIGKLWQQAYAFDAAAEVDHVTLDGDAAEVTATFSPVGTNAQEAETDASNGLPAGMVAMYKKMRKRGMAHAAAVTFMKNSGMEVSAAHEGALKDMEEARQDLTEAALIIEAHPAGTINTARLHRDTNVIEGTTLITAASHNGPNKQRIYTDAALRKIAGMAEGLPAYANHVAPADAFKPRPVEHLIGRHRNVRYEAAAGRIVSDLHVLDHQAPWVFSLAERMGDVVGNSLVSRGVIRMDGPVEMIDDIVQVRSADLVSDPAATKGLFEARGVEADVIERFALADGPGTKDDNIDHALLLEDRRVYALLQEAGGEVQTIILKKKFYDSADAARKWAKSHDFKSGDVDETGDSYRFRQAAPGKYDRMRTICLNPGRDASPEDCRVAAVIGFTGSRQESQEDNDMDLAGILTHLKGSAADLAALQEHFALVAKADVGKPGAAQLQESVATLTTERDTVVKERDAAAKELAEAKKRLDDFSARDALAAKKARLQEAIVAHDLGKQYGKVPGVVSEQFRSLLEGADEKEWAKLLDDRLALLKAVPSGTRQPTSTLKEMRGEDDLPADIHGRFARAIRG